MFVIVAGGGGLFSEPMHVEFASLKLLNDLGLVLHIPVLLRILLEVDRERRIDDGRGQFLRCQRLESLLEEFEDDVLIRM